MKTEENILPSHKTSTNIPISTNISNSNYSIQSNHTRQYQNLNYEDENSIKEFAFENCKEYLGGIWKKICSNQFQIQKVFGGLSNYLFSCSIVGNIQPIENEPTKVLLRIYGENNNKNSSVILKDTVTLAIIAEKKLGPKLYGILPIGRIEEYIPSSHLHLSDLYVSETSSLIAKLLAQFHSLKMPFVKEPRWFFDTISTYLNKIETVQFDNENDLEKMNKLMGYNLGDEFKQLVNAFNFSILLEKVNSPVVFSHNDLSRTNILRMNDSSLVLIDYEFGSYNYRGFDFGNYFTGWMLDNNYDKFPYFKCNPKNYPNREQQLYFIKSYLKEYSELNKDYVFSESEAEKILVEANYFAIASNFHWGVWAICQAASSKIKFSYLDYSLTRLDLYRKQKEKLLNGIIPPTF